MRWCVVYRSRTTPFCLVPAPDRPLAARGKFPGKFVRQGENTEQM
jgi:hypothetical protein